MPFGYQTFYHLNSELLVRYSRHGLINGPFKELTILDQMNNQLVFYLVKTSRNLLLIIAVGLIIGTTFGGINSRFLRNNTAKGSCDSRSSKSLLFTEDVSVDKRKNTC